MYNDSRYSGKITLNGSTFNRHLIGITDMFRNDFENVIEREIAAGTLEVNEDYIGDDPIVLPEGYKLKTDFGSKEA